MIDCTLNEDAFMFTALRACNEHRIKELESENRKIIEAIKNTPQNTTLEVSKQIDDLRFYYAQNIKAIEHLKAHQG